MKQLAYLLFGIFFGIVIYKTEVISWFRIQEMFRFQSFHMYGVLGVAVVSGALWVQLIKRLQLKSADGSKIDFSQKPFTKGHIIGGLMFGFGWAMTGACPGPLYALIGSGYLIVGLIILSALAGVFIYGVLKSRLPH